MISIMPCSIRQHLQEMGQGVQVIDVIRRGIAREAQHEKTILANFAQLLHAARPHCSTGVFSKPRAFDSNSPVIPVL